MNKSSIIQIRCTPEMKRKIRRLCRILSRELGTGVTITQTMEIAVGELARRKKA